MRPTRLLLPFCLMFMSVLCIGQERPRTPGVPGDVSGDKASNATLRATSALSCKTIPWPILVRNGQALDRPSRDRSVDWLSALHPRDPTFRQKLAFWRQGFDAHAPTVAKLSVSGRRTDSFAPPLQTDGPALPAGRPTISSL